MRASFLLNSTRLAKFWIVLVTSFRVLSAIGLGNSRGERGGGGNKSNRVLSADRDRQFWARGRNS